MPKKTDGWSGLAEVIALSAWFEACEEEVILWMRLGNVVG